MAKYRGKKTTPGHDSAWTPSLGDPSRASKLRIVAGSHRGRTLKYSGNPATRPMKDRTREALFSRLGGMFDDSPIAMDFFSGTGILGLEALSRGAAHALFTELMPTAANDIKLAAKQLGLDHQTHVRCGDAFQLAETIVALAKSLYVDANVPQPWLVFICPPYSLWQDRRVELENLLTLLCSQAPAGSQIAVELEEETPLDVLPSGFDWKVRSYRPAQIAIAEIPAAEDSSSSPSE